MKKNLNRWQHYFFADESSISTAKLDAAEDAVETFRIAFAKFSASAPEGTKVVRMVGDRIPGKFFKEQFAVEVIGKHKLSPSHWVPLPNSLIYYPLMNSPFFEAQLDIICKMNVLPPRSIARVIGAVGESQRSPSPARVVSRHGGIMADTETITLEAARFRGGWLFRTPVDPRTGNYFRPPESRQSEADFRGWARSAWRDMVTSNVERPFPSEVTSYCTSIVPKS